ncbi:MAG TPA: peptidyl-alpha-hydroxyglycine alpha-amidating lyase family protein [Gammaproteobacteria bacterium]
MPFDCAPAAVRGAIATLSVAAAGFAGVAAAQRPDIPPQAIAGPALGVVAVEQTQAIELPANIELGQVASVAVDARGHLLVLHRGPQALLEFDTEGRFVRGFGADLFQRAHSLTIDADGNFWITDVAEHTVTKLDAEGRVLMTLAHPFEEPTDVAVAPDGSLFVTQGHTRGEPKVLKFGADGTLLKSWGGRGTLPWQLAVAHSIAIGDDGLVYVADRENRRIQVFDLDGEFVKGWVYRGMACGLTLANGRIYMTTGFDGQIVALDMNGRVQGVTGRPGVGLGEYGEAHDIAVAPSGDLFVADVVNRRLQKLAAL